VKRPFSSDCNDFTAKSGVPKKTIRITPTGQTPPLW
jgi:hypothetical protein